MSCILLLETATKVCSVAIAENTRILVTRESFSANSHSSVITSYISEVMQLSGKSRADIDAICISMGPGSYTGLRIGTSTAKGLCYAWEKPLLAVNTLQSMVYSFLEKQPDLDLSHTLLCPMIDARRMEVYNALFDSVGNYIRDTAAEVIDENSFAEIMKDSKVIFFGDGATKCKNLLRNNNAIFIDDFLNSAAGMNIPAFRKLERKQFEDTAYFEPYYLKDFLATKPRKIF